MLALLLPACTGGGQSDGPAHPDLYVLSSAAEIKVPPPPTGAAAAADQAEVERMVGERARLPDAEVTVGVWFPDRPIRPWLDMNIDLARTTPNTPPKATRGYALTSVAVNDAVVAAWHWKAQYRRAPPTGVTTIGGPAPGSPPFSYPSEHAVIAGVASRVLRYLFPGERTAGFDAKAEDEAQSRVLAGLNFPSDVDAGLALGRAVADKVIAQARRDGSDEAWDGRRPPAAPGVWSPPPDNPAAAPIDPGAQQWKPWLMGRASRFRPPPPPAYGSPAFRDEAAEVRRAEEYGMASVANYWAAQSRDALLPPLWAEQVDNYARDAGLDIRHTARALAALHVAEHDATLAVWDAAYTYWRQSPVNAVRDLTAYKEWSPSLGTPLFPSYPSNYAAYAGVAEVIIHRLYPENDIPTNEAVIDGALSREWGGVNFPSDTRAGLELGRQIGRLALRRLP